MTCQELERLLYPYLHGEFQPEERVDLETHLAECAACRRRVEEETCLQEALRRAARHSVERMRAPASLRAGIQLGLRQEQRRAQYGVWLRASAVALVVVTAGGGWLAYQTEQRERALRQEAVRRHTRGLPFEVASTTPEQMEAWFKGKVDPRVTIPQLPKAKPLGGRIHTLNGREVAYISYETLPDHEGAPTKTIGVFVRPPEDSEGVARFQTAPAVEVDSTQGFNVVTWRDDEIVYEMVTDLDEEDIRRMLAERGASEKLARTPRPHELDSPLSGQPWSQPPPPRPSVSAEPVTYPW